MDRSKELIHALQHVFKIADISVDEIGRKAAGAAFADWQLIANGLVEVVASRHCKLIGICGSQGSGKSTLAEICVATLRQAGCNAAACSIDDFYLTKTERQNLAQTVHPLLATRGVPGTHDDQWLGAVLDGIKAGQPQRVPTFDKGLDDRTGERVLDADVLIVEGWCVGVQPQPDRRLTEPCNDLERLEDEHGNWRRWVNAQIEPRYVPLWLNIDFWVQLKPPSFDQVFEWRAQQEMQIPAERRMDEKSVRRFIEHYQRLTLWQWECPAPAPGLAVALATDHTAAAISGHV
jgi:D-glycerate 3-kinase